MRKKPIQRIVRTSNWNRFVDFYFRHRIRQVISLAGEPWRHPWFTTVTWDAVEEVWTAAIKPGACPSASSSGDPTLSIPHRMAPVEVLDRLGLAESESDDLLTAYLSEGAPLVLPVDQFRAVGTDAVATGESSEAVPEFFTRRGVVGPVVNETQSGSEVVIRVEGVAAERASARLLRACDLVIGHDRLVTRTEVIPSESLDGVEVAFSRASGAVVTPDPYLYVERKYEPVPDLDLLSLLEGLQVDGGKDTHHLATVYLLSPPGLPAGSEPDGTWQGFVDHHVFWNLQYLSRFNTVTIEPTRVAVPFPTLGQGELGRIGGIFTGAINERIEELEAGLAQVENTGRFGML